MHQRRRGPKSRSTPRPAGESELLDIKQAAALLQVSLVSLRRWTNAGLLASFRIGGRQERRFRRADLLAFLESRPTAAAPPSPIKEQKPARHLFGFYRTDIGRARLTARFLLEGLGAGALCVLVSELEVQDQVVTSLSRERPTIREEIEAGRLILAEYMETGASQIAAWEAMLEPAVARGERALWAVGDVTGGKLARQGTVEDMIAYEAEYDRVMSRFPLTTFCLYDARKLSGVDTTRLWHCHQDMFTSPVDQLVN
jgi:transcriptional repressor of dcmA and dcmR